MPYSLSFARKYRTYFINNPTKKSATRIFFFGEAGKFLAILTVYKIRAT